MCKILLILCVVLSVFLPNMLLAKPDKVQVANQAHEYLTAKELRIIHDYKMIILKRIQHNLNFPRNIDANAHVLLMVHLALSGRVAMVKVTKPSQFLAFDNAVLLAVKRSSPLPLPRSARLRHEFRYIELKVVNVLPEPKGTEQ